MGRLSFGEYVLDTDDKRVLRGQTPIEISGMSLALLCYFVEHAADGHVVTRNELRSKVWRCQVEDVTIRTHLGHLREALGDEVSRPRYLQTVGREGWRFVAPVTPLASGTPREVAVRGSLPPAPGGAYDPACYIARSPEERVLLSCLQTAARPVVLFGPPGCGKRTLLERTLERAAASETGSLRRTLRISVRSAAEPEPDSLDALLKELGRLILEAAGQTEDVVRPLLDAIWSRPILSKQKLRELLLQHILPLGTPVAIVFCDVERLAPCPFQEDVFNMLRSWQDDRHLAGVRMVLETIIPPRLFPLGAQSPLWIKSQRIDLSCIDASQLVELAERHALTPSPAECERLGELVGWNMALCRIALFHAMVRGQSLTEVLTQVQPMRRRFGGFSDHLEDLAQALEQMDAASESPSALSALLREALHGVALNLETAWRLLQKGVVAETETRGRYRIRCPLYADYVGTLQP